MKFIKLTKTDTSTIYVNITQIVSIEPKSGGTESLVLLADSDIPLMLLTSAETILRLIKEQL